MKENIGYEIPPSLKYEEKIFKGLTFRQLLYLSLGFIVCGVALKVYGLIGIKGSLSQVVLIFVLLTIISLAIAICQLRLDSVFLTVLRYIRKGKKIHRFDKEMLEFLTLRSIHHDHYFNVYSDACVILKLYTLTGDRSDINNADTVRTNDIDFLNSLPCPIQLVGYSSLFDIDKYISMVLEGSKLLPDDQQALMIGHLNHMKQYCSEGDIKDKEIYMVIRAPAGTINQVEKVSIDAKTIIKGLSSCFVVGEWLEGSRLTNTALRITCGVGRDGIDYLTDFVTLEDLKDV